MSRFYIRPEAVSGEEILVPREEAHHILDVMRLKAGDEIIAFDGTGKEYLGNILGASKAGLRIRIKKINTPQQREKTFIALAQSLPKKVKMDFIVEKATELGVDEIIPLITERTVVRLPDDKKSIRSARWQEIAISASKQCGRLSVPEVRPVARFSGILKETGNYDLAIMACLTEGTRPLKEVISNFKGRKVLAMIGPEGDFSPGEIQEAAAGGVKLVSLGPLVLRVDTAAIFIISAFNYESSV
ncbi:MAG: 16S rRNA (uracil(1498)-N(3))-methyltransferase [Candidatus Omnitrophica bacterium]|nr:16S rRNA (uracil(1498)-N(3))-methyltransferase [Candidatus Omnitrophota bacterium]